MLKKEQSKQKQKLLKNNLFDFRSNNDKESNLKTHKIDNGKINLISNISSKIKIKLGYWNEIDDIKIFNGLKKHHFSWISIKNDLPERTRISLRNRFVNSIKKLNKGGRFEKINQFLFENVYFTFGKSI